MQAKARGPEQPPLTPEKDAEDGEVAAVGEPMRDLKEAGVQIRHLSESESSFRRTGKGQVPWATEAR